jgi:proprotein convertase subtilisin/kexin type 5
MKSVLALLFSLGFIQPQTTPREPLQTTCRTLFGCVTCSVDPTVCELCNYQIMLIPSGKQCIRYAIDRNCRRLSSEFKCIACLQGYFLDSRNICTRVTQQVFGCLSQVTTVQEISNCINCGSKFVLSRDGVCEDRIRNCATYSADFLTCLNCRFGFAYNITSNTCVEESLTDPNCLTFSANNTECSGCKEGYFLNLKRCFLAIPNCENYTYNFTDAKTACSQCNQGYFLQNNQCLVRSVQGCQVYVQNTGVCSTCSVGLWLNGNICSPQNVANCRLFTNNTNNCVECNTGFTLQNQGCVSSSGPNCEVVNQSTFKCSVCKTGFYLNPVSECVVQSIPNCSVYVSNTNTCSLCAANFYLDNQECKQQSVTFCRTYLANTNQCSVCQLNYFLSNNSCLLQNIPNCALYRENEPTCLSCAFGFYLTANQCASQSIANCVAYVTNLNQCLQCDLTFFVQNGVCVLGRVENCGLYGQDINTCVACVAGYNLRANVCVSINAIPNCANQTSIVCLRCAQNYYLANNACSLQQVNNCSVYRDNENVCATCQVTFYLANNGLSCQQQDVANCTTFEVNRNVCLICSAGFYIDSGTCRAQNKLNCIGYTDNTNECVSCSASFYVSGGSCLLQNLVGCSGYLPNVNVCSTCRSGFNLIAGRCIAASAGPSNCLEADGLVCKVCANGFYVRLGKCLKQDLPFCLQFKPNLNECTSCESNYVLKGVSCVLAIDPSVTIANCYKQKDSNCTWCLPGFVPDATGKCKSQFYTVLVFNDNDNVPTYLSRLANFVTFNYDLFLLPAITSPGDMVWTFDLNPSDNVSYSILDFDNIWTLGATSDTLSISSFSAPAPNEKLWLLIPADLPNTYYFKNKNNGLFLQQNKKLGASRYRIEIRDAERQFIANGSLNQRRRLR